MLRIKLIWTTQTIFKHTSLLLLDVRHSTLRHSCPHKKHANLRTIFQTCNYHSHTHIVSTPRTLLSHLSPTLYPTPHPCPTIHHKFIHKYLYTNPLTHHTNQVITTHLDTLLYSTLISHTPPPPHTPTHPQPTSSTCHPQNQESFSPPHTKRERSAHTGEKKIRLHRSEEAIDHTG